MTDNTFENTAGIGTPEPLPESPTLPFDLESIERRHAGGVWHWNQDGWYYTIKDDVRALLAYVSLLEEMVGTEIRG